jgi:hypothetical protein
MADTSNIYDPALLSQLVELGSAPEKQGLLKQRMQYGHEEWQTPTPQGMRVGGTYIAASPLEHIASALQRGIGLAQQRGAMGGLEKSIAEQGAGRSAYANALERWFRQQQQAAEPQGPYAGEVPELVR